MWAPFKKLANKQKGFTIIEVMIVLAIAGLIIAIVLLAVPALQRSQRNNARQGDATKLSGMVADYAGNHGGSLPATAAVSATGCSTVFDNTTEKWGQLATCGIVQNATTGVGTTAFVVDLGDKCVNGAVSASSVTGAYAIVWKYEGASGGTLTCLGSGQ